MNERLKTILLFAAMLLVVVVGSWIYSRNLSRKPTDALPAALPAAPDLAGGAAPAELQPDLGAGLEALEQGRLDEAEAALRRVPPEDPAYPTALSRLAEVQQRRGQPDLAVESLRRLVALQPESPELQAEAARGYYELGRYDEAELAALRALELLPDQLEARYRIALIRVARDEAGAAIEAYHRALARDAQGGYLGRAVDELTRLRDRRPELPAVHYALAFMASTLNRPELEATALRRFLELQAGGPVADNARERLSRLTTGAGS